MQNLMIDSKAFVTEYKREIRRIRSSRKNAARLNTELQRKQLSRVKLAAKALDLRFTQIDNLKW